MINPELIEQIDHLLEEKNRVFVAISGFGGSGKTSLADQLGKHYHLKDDQIIRLDHFYSENPNGPDCLDQVNWPLLTQILQQAHAGENLNYIGKGYRGEKLSVNEKLPHVVIVEGIRLLQPDLLPYFDITVWIACPQPIALERAKARDRKQGEDEATISLWDTDWGPKDLTYYNTYHPEKLASYLYYSVTY
ncbi:MAG: hypothetical protein SP1CHLAM54_14030 [Chlamydiia bacterium]|nr:hypothetical protein [Chlamydiia bacterium]MCH9616295.1 hypothetical protein [Chlamydiia bacterium]MCH9629719.1 hypothetical protein [Chlamydiia bacterium]